MRRRALLALAVAGVLVPGVAAAQTGGGSDQVQSLQNQITEASTSEIQALAALQATENQAAALDARVGGLDTQLRAAQTTLDPLQARADAITTDYDAVAAREQAAQAQLDSAKAALDASAASMLIAAREGDGYASVEAAAPVDLATGQRYLQHVSDLRKGLVERVQSLRNQVESERRVVADQKAQADAVAHQAQALRDQVASLVAQLQPAEAQAAQQEGAEQQQLASIRSRKGEFEAELNSLQAASDSIAALLRQDGIVGGTVGHCDVRPVPGPIISGFGPRVDPISGAQGFHPGDDLQATYGTPIHACRAGTVEIASWQGGYGNAVVIDHGGGMATLYGHQSRVAVTPGQHVNAGDVIGYVGATGYATGPHLHFEVRLSGNPVDPTSYIS